MPPPDFSQSENNLGLPVKYLVKRPPVFIEPGATVTQAARAMREALIGSVLVADDPPGIITDRDLRGRVLAAGLGPETRLGCPRVYGPAAHARRAHSPPGAC
jgi:CBS domain-containing protein